MEVVVTRHNFESILLKDHPCHVCFKLADSSKMAAFSGHSFNIGPYGKKCFKIFSSETSKPISQTCHRWSLSGQLPKLCSVTPISVQNGHRQRTFKLADWFQRRRLLNDFPIGSYVKTMSADGGHFGPRSGSLNTILEVDHLHVWSFSILSKLCPVTTPSIQDGCHGQT
jgi:hypothetical protein